MVREVSRRASKARSPACLLVKQLCLADLAGAVLILPFPLVATFRGDPLY